MDIRFLESLIAVVETGSIAAAARRQNLTPAAVSQRVRALEKQLGNALLARSAHSARPTEACLALMPRMRHLTAETRALAADAAGGELSGELSIGAISTALTGMMPPVLKQFSGTAPNVRLKVSPGASDMLYEAVLAGDLDAAILVKPPFTIPKSLRAHALRREPLMLLSPHAVDKSAIRAALTAAPYVRYDPGSWGGRMAALFINEQKLQPDVFCDLDGLEAIAILVSNGIGNSLVPAWSGFRPQGLFVTEVNDDGRYDREIVLLQSSMPKRPKALDRFRRTLIETIDQPV